MKLTRRFLLTGHRKPPSDAPQADEAAHAGGGLAGEAPYCVSSAILSVLPRHMPEVLAQLAKYEGVEVHAAEGGKIVVVIEGSNSKALGDSLTRMALLEGVIAANMVYEHADRQEAAE